LMQGRPSFPSRWLHHYMRQRTEVVRQSGLLRVDAQYVYSWPLPEVNVQGVRPRQSTFGSTGMQRLGNDGKFTRVAELAVHVRGLVKRYAGTTAVDGIDLDIEVGECVSLLGPNGAGKTTAVEILEGYRTRDAGEALVLGHDPRHPTQAWRSRIGIVLQTANDNADLSVHEVVSHFAHYYPRPADPDDVIEAVGLTEKRETRTRNLSGGQRRRLDVALGIIGQPELLFLDEPTTGFDPQARREFWVLIDRLRRDGTTIFLTTHYLDEAERLADRVAVIANGRIVAEGPPETLGGRRNAAAIVSWMTSDGMRTEETVEPTRLIAELSRSFDGEIPELSVRRPSLEDIYLSLVAGESSVHDASED
jgi:ABC-2 type transport system ATP-binding protein